MCGCAVNGRLQGPCLEEYLHVLVWGLLFEHRVRALPHHVVDGSDDLRHLLGGNPKEQEMYIGERGLGGPLAPRCDL